MLIIPCIRLKQPFRYKALAVRCKQGSQLHGKGKINRHLLIYLRQETKLKNGLLDVRPVQNLHCDQGATRLSTCLVDDNGHYCSLAKCTANKDQITILARRAGRQAGVWRTSAWKLDLFC